MKKISMAHFAAVFAVVFAVSAFADSEVKHEGEKRAGWDFGDFAMIPMHTSGRLKPLDSFARELMLHLTTSRSFQGWEPGEFLLSILATPQAWEKKPFIAVSIKDTRRQLGLNEDQTRFSPADLLQDSYLAQYAYRMGSGKNQIVPNLSGGIIREEPREQEMKRVMDRLGIFRALVTGEAWLIGPDASGNWKNLADTSEQMKPIRDQFIAAVDAYRAMDRGKFEAAAKQVRVAVESRVPAASAGELSKLGAEYLYNRSHPFFWGWILFMTAALFWSASVAIGDKARVSKWGAQLLTAAGLIALIGGISLRCYIAGRPPVSNMYESIIWVSFGVMLFGSIIYAVQRQAIIMAVATGLCCFGLIAADAAPAMMDPGIHPLVPVLRSNYWLTVHVLTITLGYAAFALTLGLGNVALWHFGRRALGAPAAGLTAKIATLNQLNYRAMQFGVTLLAAGTILGGIWADYSWGRFWGWDPKEVWALIALLGYVAILHTRYVAWIGQFGFAAWTVISFLLVVMAWYGVNFVLGVGLHSYGFASGGRGWVAAFCSAQMLYVGVIAWLNRTSRKQRVVSSNHRTVNQKAKR